MLTHDREHRPLHRMFENIKTQHPDDWYLSDCLRIPAETDPDAFPWFRPPHSSCGCTECEDAHVRTIRARADLVRQHIKAGRQEMLI